MFHGSTAGLIVVADSKLRNILKDTTRGVIRQFERELTIDAGAFSADLTKAVDRVLPPVASRSPHAVTRSRDSVSTDARHHDCGVLMTACRLLDCLASPRWVVIRCSATERDGHETCTGRRDLRAIHASDLQESQESADDRLDHTP